ncbi:MAG: glycosyltransferase, partial [Planctomycetes bacterium]|nr:glycosyltransferase [Planctomycetota bacterium]
MGEPREPVSIVVCNFQGEAYLERVLGALEAQATERDELLLVDNASTDGSLALVAARFPRWRVLARSTNDGPCVARNEGLSAARHRLCFAVDNDAVVPEHGLERLVAAITAGSGAAAVQCRSVLTQDRDRVHYDGGFFHYVGLLSLRNFFTPLAEAEGVGVLPVDALVAMAVLLDRDVVLELGGYDATYFYLMEDFDLAYRLRMAGHAILIDEEVVVEH